MNAVIQVASDTGKFDRGLKTILHDKLHWLDVPDRIEYKLCVMVYRCQHGQAPRSLHTTSSQPLMLLRVVILYDLDCLNVPRCRLSIYTAVWAFHYAGPTVWNLLPEELRNSNSFDSFKQFLKTILFSCY